MRPAITIAVGILLSAAGFAAQAQIPPSQAIQAPKAAAAAAQSSSAAQTPAPAPAQATTSKSSGKKGKSRKPAASTTASAPAADASAAPAAPAAPPEPKVARRDPFESLIGAQKAAAEMSKNLPPGKAGLQVASLRLDGIVKSSNGMIAVVTNPQARTYFLREGDQLYDGRVEKIAMDGVSFHEIGKDAFGKPVERQVNKRIYSSAGEQQ
jgi:Tfp pilus assembly protein PilP